MLSKSSLFMKLNSDGAISTEILFSNTKQYGSEYR